MGSRTAQTLHTTHAYRRFTSPGRGISVLDLALFRIIALVVLALGLVSCAQFADLPDDVTRLRSDFDANSEMLARISTRLDQLERRQVTANTASERTLQELTQAIEVLLKKALVTESRLTAMESAGLSLRTSEKPIKQSRQSSPTMKTALAKSGAQNDVAPGPELSSAAQNSPSPAARRIRLGMVAEDVRRMLGDPLSIDTSDIYIFWQYSNVSNQKYVIFERVTRQVSGWWGL